jgi:hypothetical protein
MSTTLEEASKCPRCDNFGDVGPRRPTAKPGYDCIVITCKTELCPWYDTGWIVQINPDGTIPDAAPPGTVRGAKQFDVLPDDAIRAANEQAAAFQRWSQQR